MAIQARAHRAGCICVESGTLLPTARAKYTSSLPRAGFWAATARRRWAARSCSTAARPALPSNVLRDARPAGLVIVRAPAAERALVPGACPSVPHRERAARSGAGLGILDTSAPLESRDWSGRRERARARLLGPGGGHARRRRRPRRSAGRSAEEERREEGKGREEAPAGLPAKRPYLSGHSLSLPGGRLRAADPLPPGSSALGSAERALARSAGRGAQSGPASQSSTSAASAFGGSGAGLPMTRGRPADSVA